MKDWKNLYPLNTFSGEQKKELETFISSLLEEQRKELLEEVLEEIKDFYTVAPKYRTKKNLLEEIKSLIIKQ